MDANSTQLPATFEEDNLLGYEAYHPGSEVFMLEASQDIVQQPPPGMIRYADLQWLPQQIARKGVSIVSDVATIPWDRLEDFVQGEMQNDNFPCKFNRKVQTKNGPGSLALPRACSPAQVIRYHCSFGLEDNSSLVPMDMEALLESTLKKRKNNYLQSNTRQKGKRSLPKYDAMSSNLKKQGKKTRIGKGQIGKSIKRGCLCCFYAKQPYLNTSICQLIYRHSDHSNIDGEPVHGISVAGFKDSLGSTLSEGMKQHVNNLLWMGLSPSQIMMQHKAIVKDISLQNGCVTRDTFLQSQDVRNLAKTLHEALWQKHPSDPKSVKMWVDENPSSVFCYREHALLDLNVMKQDDSPFTLGIQTPWQLEMLIEFGHNSALSFDATFGTSETRYPLYTVMVFDEWRNGIPVAFFVISQAREKDLQHVLLELQNRAKAIRSDWTPSSIIVDNAQAEINVIRKLWPTSSIFLCLWHVQKAWRENAIKKIACGAERSRVLQALGDIMYGKGLPIEDNPVQWVGEQLQKVLEGGSTIAVFARYFKEQWLSKASMWCVGSRSIPHAGQNTNAAIESYHGNLKNILKSSRQRFDGRRLDWLIYHLVGDVVTHYWYAVKCKLFGFVRNTAQERIVATAIVRARSIPDCAIRLFPEGEDIALVASVNHRPQVWTIQSPDSEWAQCDCFIGLQGMICKHTMKVFRLIHPELSEGLIVREIGSSQGVNKVLPLSQSFLEGDNLVESSHSCWQDNVGQSLENCNTEPTEDVAVDIGEPKTTQEKQDPKIVVGKLFKDLVETAEEHPELFDHLISDLKISQGKQNSLLARRAFGSEHPPVPRVFPVLPGDKSLKRYRSFLEPKARKSRK